MSTLIIVESPAKCKTIEQLLGPGYKCVATFGHLRTIPSLEYVDLEHQFQPTYQLFDTPLKRKLISQLREEILRAKEVILSSDLDREGEAISFAIMDIFQLPLTTKRITFSEITESALRYALQHPRTIDMNLVHAQLARQVMDLLVGFQISPTLWKAFPDQHTTLSAGRCQTPALKLVYDNEQRYASAGTPVYQITGYFTNLHLPFVLASPIAGADSREVEAFLQSSVSFAPYVFAKHSPTQHSISAPPPLTTSRLQQLTSNQFRYSPAETMKVAQSLYEQGLITYMRTDSTHYSEVFLQSAREYIGTTYGDLYWKEPVRDKEETSEPHAHEAIRPTRLSLQQLTKTSFNAKEKKLYRLIWTNTVESCMADALVRRLTATITSPLPDTPYVYTAEETMFSGWQVVNAATARPAATTYNYLQLLANNHSLTPHKICARVELRGLPSHLTEASLVRLLEEHGIGRPSTYASLVEKLQDRGYVVKTDIPGTNLLCQNYSLEGGVLSTQEEQCVFGKERDKLVIQPLGRSVVTHLYERFPDLFAYDYTRQMEGSLDQVARGLTPWVTLCASLHETLQRYLSGAIPSVERNPPSPSPSPSDLKSSSKTAVAMGTYQEGVVEIHRGKYGRYATWKGKAYPLKKFGNRPTENLSLDEIIPLLNEGYGVVREIAPKGTLSVRKGERGYYLWHKPSSRRTPVFLSLAACPVDYLTCDVALLKGWITETYGIRFP